ncbi:NAD-binding protein [Haloarculaceae archaeon H-GB2-1]|nr:NAD-binding protein [Haloarculaceae archaeon H-GB1-1]MEA5386365.1 NAD-binding protein [Haloarculaceae archaeon H-GB11]MEA5407871.1 NAD-binding protein [Haloarculaceae archaeon H-GB2-1]
MQWRRRRFVGYLAAFIGVIGLYTLLYSWGMAMFEGQPRSLSESLLVVVETFTTTGYGEDAVWDSPQMIGLMVVMQFTGVIFIFMALPLFVVPWIEQGLSTTPPTAVQGLADHVVICSYTPRIEMLIEELDQSEIPYVVVESDRETATDLYDDGIDVIHGDPESTRTLVNADITFARSVVVDVDDEANASVGLAIEEVVDSENGPRVISFVEDPDFAEYHRYAGIDQVLLPRQLVGESLANKITTSVSADVGDGIEIGADFEIVELPVQPGSELVDVKLADSGLREQTGANVIGAWFRGEFVMPPSPDDVIDERTVLLVAGHEAQVEHLKQLTRTERRDRRHGPVTVCGYGEVGSTVKKVVTKAGIDCRAVDIVERPGVDVVGDVTEKSTFEELGIEDVSTVILALSDDTAAIFATLVLRQMDPDIEIIARANEIDSVQRLYRAGADYVLALGTVSGRMLASTILDEDVLSYDQQIEVVRMDAGDLVGRSIADADVRARTGCTILAIERNGSVVTDFDPSFRFEDGDDVIVAGPDEAIIDFGNLVD